MMQDSANGTVVWFQQRFGRGVVRLDSGRQVFFSHVDGIEDLQPRLRVRVLNPEAGIEQVVVSAAEGLREFAPEGTEKQPKGEKRQRNRKGGKPALPEGTSVGHKAFGQGFVVASSARMVRVRFTDSGDLRTVRLSSLERLDGHE